jgi:hypothetical protein
MPRGWRYFLRFRDDEASDSEAEADAGRATLYRLGEGSPEALLEVLQVTGSWNRSSLILAVVANGSDYDFTEITAERAQGLVERWVASSHLSGPPSGRSPTAEQ